MDIARIHVALARELHTHFGLLEPAHVAEVERIYAELQAKVAEAKGRFRFPTGEN